MNVPLQVDHFAFQWDEILLDQVRHVALDRRTLELPNFGLVLNAFLPQILMANPELSALLDDFWCVCSHCRFLCAKVQRCAEVVLDALS